MHYHIDMKHNTYWEVESETREIPLEPVNVKSENDIIEDPETFGCRFCERNFSTNQGRRIHASKMHKDKLRNIAHNKDFILERKESVTKSPPAKKTKEPVAQLEEIKAKQINNEKDPKDEEIRRLQNIILQLQNGILCKETKSVRQPAVLDPVINVIYNRS